MTRAPARAAGFALSLLTACVGPRPSSIEERAEWLVVISSVRLPESEPWYTRFAEHTWIDLRCGSEEDWWRLEVASPDSGVLQEAITAETARADRRWGNRVFVLATLEGPEARVATERLFELAESHPDFGLVEFHMSADGESWSAKRSAPEREAYVAWPGPNSNTFVADLVAGTPGLTVELHHNAVGKDYARGFHADRTSSGLGWQLDSDYLGAGLGLREGAELHLLGLTLGVGLWPPALKLPVLPRMGVHQGWVSRR
jgi:Protein of unknown function (DUF3750)